MPDRFYEPVRLEAFSDGVFAIAITLLVIEIKVPHHDAIAAAGGLWPALGRLWPSYLAFAISFLTIGIMWANHHAISHYVRRVDRPYVLATVLLLLAIAFVPFTTAVLAEHVADPHARTAATVFYGAWFVFTAVAFNVVWWTGIRGRRLLGADVHEAGLQIITRRYRLGPVWYLVSVGLALLNVWLALAVHAALAALFALSEREGGSESS
jgi:uncharacterized membrane protein